MSKDLTEALHALTVAASGKTSRVDKTLPEARVPSSIPARTGASGPIAAAAAAGDSWTLKGENTLITSDGLFAIYFPETLEANIGGKLVTVGAIKTEAPA